MPRECELGLNATVRKKTSSHKKPAAVAGTYDGVSWESCASEGPGLYVDMFLVSTGV